MEPMLLKVEVPVMAAYAEQRGRQTAWIKAHVPVSIEAMVYGLRRVKPSGGAVEFMVKALARIPLRLESQIPKSDFVDSHHAWVDCLYAANRNSLAAFRDCADSEWMSPAAPNGTQPAAVSA